MSNDKYSAQETSRRRDEVIRQMANTPPQPRVSHPSMLQKRKLCRVAPFQSAALGRLTPTSQPVCICGVITVTLQVILLRRRLWSAFEGDLATT
jgi:hypothetical protein